MESPRERISEIIAAINRIFGEGATEAQQLKRIGVLAAMGESLRRNNTVRKQIDAGNSEDAGGVREQGFQII